MSQHLISRYLNELSDLRRASGRSNESIVREAFKTLLKDWGRSKDLIFVPEYPFETVRREQRFIDGALFPSQLRVPYGFWEAKDEDDDLDREIERKFRRGYPQDNIAFEDSRQAVLFQNRREVMRCPVDDPAELEKLLNLFFSHERPEIEDFRKAVAQFKTDLPAVLAALRGMIERAEATNPQFCAAALVFLQHAQETINPSVTAADVREMLIQHILTEDIFSHVFDNADFHRQNNVARELYKLEETFFTGTVKRQTLEALRAYYAAIRSAAALVSSHHEKQAFLKVVYENFYKVYNPKAADRLGVVYTPNEIVRFMIEGADWLCQRHFSRQLIDRNVEILDPAVGTGTFIAELIEHFRGQPAKLKHKYREELHANEVAILPYYVANLNIEASYATLTGEYEEYPNLCFVDTLDNIAGLRQGGAIGDLFGAVSEENVFRIKRQNERKISVVIGNPPYNANQLSEITPEAMREEIIDRDDMDQDIGSRIRNAPSLLRLASRSDLSKPSAGTCARIANFLRPEFERVAAPASADWEAEHRIRALTEEQFAALDSISDNPVCLLRGPAGTGKTLLGIESARRAAAAGNNVLVLCFNHNLGTWLAEAVRSFGPGRVVAGNVHSLLRERIMESSLGGDLAQAEASGMDRRELFGRLYFELGALAIEESDESFGQIIWDEVQDLPARAVGDLVGSWMRKTARRRVLLLGDFTRQALYTASAMTSVEQLQSVFGGLAVFNLHLNCRNTRRIALQTGILSGFGEQRVSERQPDGEQVSIQYYAARDEGLGHLARIVRLLRQSGRKALEVVLLGPRRREASLVADTRAIGGWPIRDLADATPGDLAYSTIHAFKGLERPVVIIVDAEAESAAEADAILYVGMSRARLRLFILVPSSARDAIERRLATGTLAAAGLTQP